ncbi:hypothetical protein QBC32DRAFT_385465 [Pseudoneurospora amorphoporcata]|uniref:Uncharacterized protein n=1 Tax=Pseudoneurospora amorphoporcata TaxID=241081 RepID=A0AAN6SI57_9PEZI|nr:hypothetical protein QBC32DRAFT_385465 [Pseudoneurospora amorphoporcata]
MPRSQDLDSGDSSSLREAYASLSKLRQDGRDEARREKLRNKIREIERIIENEERRQRHLDLLREPDLPPCLRGGESSPLNPLRRPNMFLDKDNKKYRLIMSHNQDLYERSRHPDLLLYDPTRPLPNLLLRLWGAPLSALVDLLQYPPPPTAAAVSPFRFPKDWLLAQALFLDQDLNPRKHPVFKYQFLTMDSLSTMPEDFMVMFARDISPWIMRKMDNWRPYCESGRHNLLNHYLLGWCWFWLQMEVTQRVDRIRAFVLEDEYERLRGKKDGGRERERERERVRRGEEEEDEENPFKRFGIEKNQALREARDFVERISGIGALWFPDSEGKGKFEKYFGDAIPPERKLSGEGNTREYCVACNLSVVAGSGEEVLTALLANMIARAPCKNEKDVAEEDGGLPRLYPLVDAWIGNLGEERAKVVKAKVKKLALTLFTIRKYLRWKKTPQGRDKWLYTDCEDPLDEEEKDKNTLPPVKETKYLEPVPEDRKSSTSPSRHPPPSSPSRQPASFSSSSPQCSHHHPMITFPSPSSPRNRDRESYSSKHAVPLSFYNLSNSQVSPAPAPIPSEMVHDYGTHKNPKNELTSTALVRTCDYPSETWAFESDGGESFDGDAATTITNFSNNKHNDNDDADDDMEIISVATWSHLSAVPEALILGKEREEKEAQTTREREEYRKERACDGERYRHEGDDGLVSSSQQQHSAQRSSEREKSTDTRDWAKNGAGAGAGGDRDRDPDAKVVDRERYRHEGDHRDKHPSSTSSSRRGRHHSQSHSHSHGDRHRHRDGDAELTRTALKLQSIKDNVKDHLHLSRKKSGSGEREIEKRKEEERRGGSSSLSSSSRRDRDRDGDGRRR